MDDTLQRCAHCSWHMDSPELRHLGLGRCRRLDITVVRDSDACGSYAPAEPTAPGATPGLCIYALMDGGDALLAHVLGTLRTPYVTDIHGLNAMGWSLLELARGELAGDYAERFAHGLVLADEFWTCGCGQDCIRHQDQGPCPLCGVQEHTRRLPRLSGLLRQSRAARRLANAPASGNGTGRHA